MQKLRLVLVCYLKYYINAVFIYLNTFHIGIFPFVIYLSVHIIVHLYHFRKLVKYPVSGLLFGHNRQLHSTALSDKGDNISVRLEACASGL